MHIRISTNAPAERGWVMAWVIIRRSPMHRNDEKSGQRREEVEKRERVIIKITGPLDVVELRRRICMWKCIGWA